MNVDYGDLEILHNTATDEIILDFLQNDTRQYSLVCNKEQFDTLIETLQDARKQIYEKCVA